MSRVLSVVDKSIMVSIRDVVPGDILYSTGGEGDPIVERVEEANGLIRFHWKVPSYVPHTVWMNPDSPKGGKVFIHDLKQERKEWSGEPNSGHILVDRVIKEIMR